MIDGIDTKKKYAANELQLENVHVAYRKKEILRGVSLTLQRGDIVAVIGPNGAGKSTLLKVIAGFLSPLSGEILFNGRSLKPLEPHKRVALGIGYFMQGGKVFPNLSIKENLEISSLTLSADQRKKEIGAVLRVFPNLRNFLDRRAGLLSGGERQALALAMMLIKRPRLLLLDEPSAGLSPKLVQDMLEKACEVNRAWGTTILLVEQNVREALSIAHRALALVSGTVALETQQPKQWLTDGKLEQLFLGQGKQVLMP